MTITPDVAIVLSLFGLAGNEESKETVLKEIVRENFNYDEEVYEKAKSIYREHHPLLNSYQQEAFKAEANRFHSMMAGIQEDFHQDKFNFNEKARRTILEGRRMTYFFNDLFEFEQYDPGKWNRQETAFKFKKFFSNITPKR